MMLVFRYKRIGSEPLIVVKNNILSLVNTTNNCIPTPTPHSFARSPDLLITWM